MGCWKKEDTSSKESVDFDNNDCINHNGMPLGTSSQEEGYERSKTRPVMTHFDPPSPLQHQEMMPVRDIFVGKLPEGESSHTELVDHGYYTGPQKPLEKYSDDSESTTSEYLLPHKPQQCTSEKICLRQKSGFICDKCKSTCAHLCTGRFDWKHGELYVALLQMQQQPVDRPSKENSSVKTYSLRDRDWQDLDMHPDRHLHQPHHHDQHIEHNHRQPSATGSNSTTTDIAALDKQNFGESVEETEPGLPEHKVEFVVHTPCLPFWSHKHVREKDSRPSLKVMHAYPTPFICNMSMYVGEETSLIF